MPPTWHTSPLPAQTKKYKKGSTKMSGHPGENKLPRNLNIQVVVSDFHPIYMLTTVYRGRNWNPFPYPYPTSTGGGTGTVSAFARRP